MLYCFRADITDTVSIVSCVAARSYFVRDSECAVVVTYKVDSNNSATGDKELISIDALLCVIKNSGCYLIAKICVGHKPVVVIACLDTDEAVLSKENCNFAVYELVDTDCSVIVLASVRQAVDITEEVILGFFHSTDCTL